MLSCMWLNRESWLVLSVLTLGASFVLQATVLAGWLLLGHARRAFFAFEDSQQVVFAGRTAEVLQRAAYDASYCQPAHAEAVSETSG